MLDWVSRWISHGTLADVEYVAGEALAASAQRGGGAIMTLSCWHDGEKVIVEVSDVGGDRGFGLHLMHKLSDGVEFFDNGRRVRLHKQLSEDDHTFRKNVRRQKKRRALRDFTRGVTFVRFVQSALRRQRRDFAIARSNHGSS